MHDCGPSKALSQLVGVKDMVSEGGVGRGTESANGTLERLGGVVATPSNCALSPNVTCTL